jgi:hypothetical protein
MKAAVGDLHKGRELKPLWGPRAHMNIGRGWGAAHRSLKHLSECKDRRGTRESPSKRFRDMKLLQCDENSLRELFSSQDDAGAFVLDAITGGMTVVIQMNDGTTLELGHPEHALQALAEYFGWCP